MIKEALFYSKILLFGEYGIIQDSMGLSIPYRAFRGEFKFTDDSTPEQQKSTDSLEKFARYIHDISKQEDFNCVIDVDAFKRDIARGVYFDSTIPQGFGVGSSGALVAAVYDKYAQNKIDSRENIAKNDILDLKNIFGNLEAHFHGKSSGIDPLICYLKLPILIKSKSDLGTVGIPESKPDTVEGSGAIFLLNSGQPGETQPMVNIFMERMKNEGFRNMIKKEFKKYNDECIKAFLNGDSKPLFQNLKSLSSLLLDNFKPMIPKTFHSLWEKGLESNAYYLKLCGSGGGGFVLGFTQNLEKAQSLLKDHELEVIYRL